MVTDRTGFNYALNNPQQRTGERQFDPVQRHYAYADERFAAEDAAYVLFDLWRSPLDICIEVDASAFNGSQRWECSISMG